MDSNQGTIRILPWMYKLQSRERERERERESERGRVREGGSEGEREERGIRSIQIL